MTKNFVNLNVNQCKMCMPLGASLAFKGIEKSMVILHGSQGCSTYIRRHMATHYNEPIDIASSSLTENGTIYGGAKNLKSGLKNLIKIYSPEAIGILTTCLAETIGEDIERIVKEFIEEEKDADVKNLKFICVHTPGYGATQAEGYYTALRSIVEQLARPGEKSSKINIIMGNVNPGDVRNIKSILKMIDVDFIIYPDISETLDAPYTSNFERIPPGGTRISDIENMANSVATIEMGVTIDDKISPGAFLMEKFQVPLHKCPIPIGLRNNDLFLNLIKNITGKELPYELEIERGRLIDTMVDNHKYNGEVRAAIYGEPELVYSVVMICAENGILPKIIATGSNNHKLKMLLMDSNEFNEDIIFLNDTDFETIENCVVKNDINLLIGSSDSRRMAERLHLDILRIGFPVHDRVGAQRTYFTGYNGSQVFIDLTANLILSHKEETFRDEAYKKYFIGSLSLNKCNQTENLKKTDTHPCFNENAHKYARMHLPIVPACNISCNYCNRDFDCVNESRPGVTSEILNPKEALEKFKVVNEKIENLTVLGIAGPGEALANFDNVRKTVELIRQYKPEITFCLSTNGLMLPFYANEIIDLGFSNITITINAIDPFVAEKIYGEVNYLGKKYTGLEAANIIIRNQLDGLKYLTSKGVICKVNIVLVKGINDFHIPEVVTRVKELGAHMTNIMPMIPVKGSKFGHFSPANQSELKELRDKCGLVMKQMYHCKQCRADAIGTLGKDCSSEFRCKV